MGMEKTKYHNAVNMKVARMCSRVSVSNPSQAPPFSMKRYKAPKRHTMPPANPIAQDHPDHLPK